MRHTLNKILLSFFIKNSIFFLFLNIIGPPSSLIVKKNIRLRYRKDLKWLVDVDYYFKLFNNLKDHRKIKILSQKDASVFSNQSFDNSITYLLKKDKKAFNKLKKVELFSILKDIRKIFIYHLYILPFWIMF